MEQIRAGKMRGAFVATSFGFGPASKAVTIAREFKWRFPDLELHYFGSGIDRDFVVQNDVFDEIHSARTDTEGGLAESLPRLRCHDFVVSVLNFDLLRMWRGTETPLYYVDSLAWMLKSPPNGIENVAAYFVQDFLIERDQIESWGRNGPLVLVPPITEHLPERTSAGEAGGRENRLLVNFAGCGNPYVGSDVYKKYAITLSRAIVSEAHDFDEVQICCNVELADFLRPSIPERSVKIGQLLHYDFLEQLSTSRMLLTSPGVTTTLEALRAGIPFRFLLPQNDSQAMMSEIYCKRGADGVCMAFSSFGNEFSDAPSTIDLSAPAVAVSQAAKHLEKILDTRLDTITSKIRFFLSDRNVGDFRNLLSEKAKEDSSGQKEIVEHIAKEALAGRINADRSSSHRS